MRLGGAPDHAVTLHLGDRLDDHRAAPLEVEPPDPQRRHLAEPDPGVGQEQHRQPIPGVAPVGQRPVLAVRRGVAALVGQRLDLGDGQEPLLAPHRAGQVDPLRDVAGQPAVADGEVEHQRQHPVDLADRGGRAGAGQTVTQACTSAWVTWSSRTFCQRGRTWWRTMPAYRSSVEGLRWAWPASQVSAHSPIVIFARCGSTNIPSNFEASTDGGEPVGVALGVEGLVPLGAGGSAVVHPPRDTPATAASLLDAGHDDLLVPDPDCPSTATRWSSASAPRSTPELAHGGDHMAADLEEPRTACPPGVPAHAVQRHAHDGRGLGDGEQVVVLPLAGNRGDAGCVGDGHGPVPFLVAVRASPAWWRHREKPHLATEFVRSRRNFLRNLEARPASRQPRVDVRSPHTQESAVGSAAIGHDDRDQWPTVLRIRVSTAAAASDPTDRVRLVRQ